MSLLQVFVGVVLPVFLIAAAGAVLQRFRPLPVGPLSQVILYLFSPALVFHSLATTQVSVGDMGKIALFSILLLAALYAIAWAAGWALRLDRASHGSFIIAVLFMNAGNYGLPVSLFAFGEAGLSRAVVFFVIQAVLGWTVGVFVASRAHAGIGAAARSVLKVPTSYAALAGFLIDVLNVPLPQAVLRASDVLGDAAIPAMLVVLGIQLVTSGIVKQVQLVGVGVVLRLVGSAALAFALVQLLGMDPLTEKVLITVSGMPTAVFTIILAMEYGGKPDLASSMVVVSTMGSLATLTVLLALLGAG